MNNVLKALADRSTSGDTLLDEQTRRERLLRIIARLSFAAFAVFLIGYLVTWLFVPDFPLLLIGTDIVAIFVTLAVLRLLSRGSFMRAVGLYTAGVTFILFTAVYFVNGTMGPIVLALPVIALIAGELGGRKVALITTAVHIVIYVVLAILEAVGVLVPYQMPEIVSRLIWGGIFITAATVMVAINQQFVAFMHTALSTSRKREETLAEVSQQAQAAAAAERAAQQQALETAQQLQEVAREYVAFLEQVAGGDYSAILDLDALAGRENMPLELISLGEYINTTVASLVEALDEAQSIQERYLVQSWEGLMEARRAPGGYRYRAGEADDASQVEVDEDAWLPQMTRAVHSRDVTVETQELALPIASGTRAQLIGALGVRREGSEAWSEDELALVTTVTDQLAQTLENLRLLDETTRRAAREQMAGEITGRIREAVEIEAVLERALSELGRAFAAERGTAYLALGEQEEA